ncbi:thiol-disulfide oxidoreductase ResA [Saliterribacillus persicus]|uniref:Peroxiredoxin n=1 Tax=Saliterribacillus persicus TaxID=930114 RepID=A0A368XA88_9BACI|nr:thiol-disulfide oxidoreductase ResA [Saliterribacillus persicus]RCW64872.1 peroxiredoxin [Saliterribacillus persicus]
MSNTTERSKNKTDKKKKRLIFRFVILILLFSALLFAVISNVTEDEVKVDIGDVPPNFELTHVNGDGEDDKITLSELEGKGVMLNFWATYCKPCEEEMPYMESLYPEYKEKGVEIVAVSVDLTRFVVDNFIEKYQLTFPVVHDNKNQVMDAYGIGPLPTTFFINPDGTIEERVIGPLTLDRLEGYLKQIQPIE